MDENKKKHLEFAQSVISRMNSNSFLLKGWSITIISALMILTIKDGNSNYMLITSFSTITFWLLDGYYLSMERQYRSLYNHVRELDNPMIDFDMNILPYKNGRNTWFKSFFSKTLLLFYILMISMELSIFLIIVS
jgi:hypothetical protein